MIKTEPHDLPVQFTVVTAPAPGAVAIIQLHGAGCGDVMTQLTGGSSWQAHQIRLCHFSDIDHGLVTVLREDWMQLMPHGGPRVVQRISEWLLAAGCFYQVNPPGRQFFPEAECEIEADALAMVGQAASPAAIDLLLAQPDLWRHALVENQLDSDILKAIATRAEPLKRLLHPPVVVVVGQPNVGKSTLTNFMLGRSASIVADLPGTTRDWVAGLAELVDKTSAESTQKGAGPTVRGIAVQWLDTPGLRTSDDAIEQQAIVLARLVLVRADIVIALRDDQIDWPNAEALPREPDIWCINKIDRHMQDTTLPADGVSRNTPLGLSSRTGTGTAQLQSLIIHKLGLHDLSSRLWVFSEALQQICETGDLEKLRSYLHQNV